MTTKIKPESQKVTLDSGINLHYLDWGNHGAPDVLLLHTGTMPKELTRKNTELFAKEVLPAIKPIYSEYEDPWWPDSLKQGSLHAVGD